MITLVFYRCSVDQLLSYANQRETLPLALLPFNAFVFQVKSLISFLQSLWNKSSPGRLSHSQLLTFCSRTAFRFAPATDIGLIKKKRFCKDM